VAWKEEFSPMPKTEPQRLLVPDRLVAERYHRSSKTIARWAADPKIGFPPVIRLRNRRYRDAAALETWEAKQRGTTGAR
jgi:hypothetical protein